MQDHDHPLTTAEAASHLGLSVKTLSNLRASGSGPRYKRRGGRITYTLDDLRRWDRERTIYGP